MTKPVLFVTNHAPPFRVGAFRALHARQGVVFALIGGNVRHGGGGTTVEETMPFPVVRPSQRAVARLAASGRFRAVIAGMSGKVALPAAYAGARAGRIPFVLWATIWAHPRTPAQLAGYPLLRHIYRHADAIATYGPHVSAYVRTKHPKGPVFEAPQAVDGAFWGAAATPERHGDFQILFAGRPAPEKGFDVLERAADIGTLVTATDRAPTDLRNLYAGQRRCGRTVGSHARLPRTVGTRRQRSLPPGSSRDRHAAVGAAAGGLVQHERTGLVVPAGDARRSARRSAPPARRPRAARDARRQRPPRGRRVHPRGVGRRHDPCAHRRRKGLLA